MNRMKVIALYSAVLLVSFGIWSLVFGSLGPKQGEKKEVISKGFTDRLSGQYVSTESINNVQSINPDAPYLIGFDRLTTYTISEDEQRYVKDFITNYVLDHTEKRPSIVSLVDKSFKGPFLTNEGFVSSYRFDFGINNEDIHTLKAVYNVATEEIDLTIEKDSNSVTTKKFKVYRF